ncbi:MAG: hypothetical protein AAF773_14200 [Cyanobacteria bacterium P01_D01_bin.115]
MNESTNPVSNLTPQQQIEQELLHSLLNQEEAYPWNLYDPATPQYLEGLEQASEATLLDEALDSKWQQVSQLAAQLWESPTQSLLATLTQKFGARMPAHLLQTLAASTQVVASDSGALIDQLVTAAQSVLTGWDADDLNVMARPLAMAMRSGQEEILEVTLRSVRQTDWADLSEVEQARLSLAIARYALNELSA